MTSQLRMYTINLGMMNAWVKLFTESLVPIKEKHGIKIEGMWAVHLESSREGPMSPDKLKAAQLSA